MEKIYGYAACVYFERYKKKTALIEWKEYFNDGALTIDNNKFRFAKKLMDTKDGPKTNDIRKWIDDLIEEAMVEEKNNNKRRCCSNNNRLHWNGILLLIPLHGRKRTE